MIEKNELIRVFAKIESTKIDEFDQNLECKKKIVDDYRVRCYK